MACKSSRKKIAVIGAGVSGLTAIKACQEEGMDVICFEKTNNFGGLWRYDEEVSSSLASIMKTLVTNSSKEMTAFSDFPPPEDFPNFLHHTKVLEYVTLYAKNFDLLRHIRYQQEVIKVTPAENYDDTGQWTVVTKYTGDENSSSTTEAFDGVMICTGHHVYANQPTFRNQHNFRGKMIHSKLFKTAAEYEDKNVLVVGFGSTAADVAVEISNVAKQVYISTRRGSWIFPRVGPKGMPMDTVFLRRHLNFLQKVSFSAACSYTESMLNARLNHALYKIQPEHRVLSQHPTINDDIPDKILTGRVIIKGDISKFEERGAIFQGESKVTELDAVVFATGYQVKFPFLDDSIFLTVSKDLNLYKYVFPVNLKYSTIAIIGLCQPIGSVIPICESQSRWASLVFNGKVKPPEEEIMAQDIEERRKQTSKRYINSPRHAIQVEFIEYMDELAEQYGAKPNITGLFFKDPSLFWSCFTGPSLSYQYRLQGPHSWEGARGAILTSQERILAPLKPKRLRRKTETDESATRQNNVIYVCIFALFLVFVFLL